MRFVRIFTVLFFCAMAAQAQVPGAAIDVQHYRFALQLNDENNEIKGEAAVTVKFLRTVNNFSLNLVKQNDQGKGMLVSSVKIGNRELKFTQDDNVLNIMGGGRQGLIRTFTIIYSGIPADGLIISKNKYGHRTFFGDNWPDRAHNWLPCVDDVADKASVEFVVTAPSHYQVVSNGVKTEEMALPGDMKLTHWEEPANLSTTIMVIGVADFAINHSGDVKGVPVYTYVFPEDSVRGFKDYAVAVPILTYYTEKVAPFAYPKLANVQSKTIFGGMENAGCIFYFEESVGDKGIEALMAHEIAHQWFGDAASEKSFAHLWLSEGFATFMANVYLEQKYGIDTLKKRLVTDRDEVLAFEKKRATPVVDTAVHSNYMQLLNANSYQKGGWVLQMLRKQLGEEKFWAGIRAYFARYNGGNATTADLEHVMEQVSGQDLHRFFQQWLYTAGVPDLAISWKYIGEKKIEELTIEQKQKAVFQFPLTIDVGGKQVNVNIKDNITRLQIPVDNRPANITIDPDVSLLAHITVVN